MDQNLDIVKTRNVQLADLNNIEKKKYLQKIKILKYLYINGAQSNADIYSRFDISSPTSVKLIHELLKEGLVRKHGSGKSEGGRRPELYGLQDNSFLVLSIHVKRFSIRIGIFDNNNKSVSEIKTVPLDISSHDAIEKLYEYAQDVVNRSGIPQEKIIGIGISMPGLINPEEGKNFTHFINNETSESLQDIWERKFEKPVLLLNDAKSGCLAEARFGQAQSRKDVLVISIDGGLGLGIITDGKIQSGTSGFAGEFGHIPFEEDGRLCYCGKRGCLETVASGYAMSRLAKEGIKSGESLILNEFSPGEIGNIEPEMIIKAAHRGDQFAINVLSEIGINLGKGIAILIQLFNPEMIVLQGVIAEAKQYITIPIQQSINTYCMTQLREKTSIVLSDLGQDAIILGSVAAVMEHAFNRQIKMAKAIKEK